MVGDSDADIGAVRRVEVRSVRVHWFPSVIEQFEEDPDFIRGSVQELRQILQRLNPS